MRRVFRLSQSMWQIVDPQMMPVIIKKRPCRCVDYLGVQIPILTWLFCIQQGAAHIFYNHHHRSMVLSCSVYKQHDVPRSSSLHPPSTRHQPNVGSMLYHFLRRWSNIAPAIGWILLFSMAHGTSMLMCSPCLQVNLSSGLSLHISSSRQTNC